MRTFRLALLTLLALPLLAATPLPPPATDELVAEARALAGKLQQGLQGELFAALKQGGPVNALTVCRDRAPGIATTTATGTPWQVGRTAERFRNPANAPDAWESVALTEFARRLQQGEAPPQIERWEIVERDGARVFRYARAIVTAEPCLNCHGAALQPEVAAEIRRLYPQDRATGFTAGELRGAFTLSRPL